MRKTKIIIIVIAISLSGCMQDESGVEIPGGYWCKRFNKIYDFGFIRNSGNLCFNKSYLYKISCDTEARAEFIIDCARAANPMSDEEGEDLVKECGRQSEMFCVNKYFTELNK